MKEYIERETLLKECDDTISNIQFSSPYQDEIGMMVSGMERIRDNIYDAPAADVEPVEHGEWIFINQATNYLEPPHGDTCGCSVCGYEIDVSDTYRFRYCPICGAKMDGGK